LLLVFHPLTDVGPTIHWQKRSFYCPRLGCFFLTTANTCAGKHSRVLSLVSQLASHGKHRWSLRLEGEDADLSVYESHRASAAHAEGGKFLFEAREQRVTLLNA
jgi:hypothetical protein